MRVIGGSCSSLLGVALSRYPVMIIDRKQQSGYHFRQKNGARFSTLILEIEYHQLIGDQAAHDANRG